MAKPNRNIGNSALTENTFNYSNGTDKNPSVLTTSRNQHQLRGFNTNYMTKQTVSKVQNEWNKIKNQAWSTSTKERVILRRVPIAQKAFRAYSMSKVKGI